MRRRAGTPARTGNLGASLDTAMWNMAATCDEYSDHGGLPVAISTIVAPRLQRLDVEFGVHNLLGVETFDPCLPAVYNRFVGEAHGGFAAAPASAGSAVFNAVPARCRAPPLRILFFSACLIVLNYLPLKK